MPTLNMPIDKLIELYESEGDDYSDLNWMIEMGEKYGHRSPDSQMRCLVYAMSKHLRTLADTLVAIDALCDIVKVNREPEPYTQFPDAIQVVIHGVMNGGENETE